MKLLFQKLPEMTIVADESVDFGIISILREKGIIVISISENYSGIEDTEVLKIAVNNDCLLVTEDKDFGELVYRLKLGHKGVLLIRLSELPRNERIEIAAETIEKLMEKLMLNFSVLSILGLRIKSFQNKKE
jgi:predicted nuclease of predicted toxin-antitoxin system